ncbi:MAG: hypothetical protein V2A73_19910 [Pseudomonadota bacterium]
MYLATQRVRAPNGQQGTNTFLSLHGHSPVPRMPWDSPDVDIVADAYPGALASQLLEVEPGGNDVFSYLDIAAADGKEATAIAAVLAVIEDVVGEPVALPIRHDSNAVSVRFSAALGLAGLDLVAELRRLAVRSLLVLGHVRDVRLRRVPSRIFAQLIVRVVMDEHGCSYALDDPSARRVRWIRPDLAANVRLRVANANKSDLERVLGGELHAELARAITGLSDEQIAALGGISFVDAARGHVLWERVAPPSFGTSDIVAASEEVPNQKNGCWYSLASTPPTTLGCSTGAVLPRPLSREDDFLCLDLVRMEDAWFPLSEAGLATYTHGQHLAEREGKTGFAMASGSGGGIGLYEAVLAQPLRSRDEVMAFYGSEAARRSRPDRPTVQLHLRRRV